MSDLPQVRRNAAHCTGCAMRHLCVPEGLCATDVVKLENVISATRRVRRGDTLFRAGDAFESLYAVRSGSLKTVVRHEGGREQVTGLLLSGDVLGLDGNRREPPHLRRRRLGRQFRVHRALQSVRARLPRLGRVAAAHASHEEQALNRVSDHTARLGMLRTAERVARMQLDLSARFARRGYATAEFTLRMTCDDIGSYLGMTLETVSRTLSRFAKLGLIDVRGKSIRIRDFDKLRNI